MSVAPAKVADLTAGAMRERLVGGDLERIAGHDSALTARLDQVLAHCGDVGINVEWESLGTLRRGEYRWWQDTIVLNLRLTEAQAVSCLLHELGHRKFGDQCSSPAAERRAWEYGAAMFITPTEYERAEELVGHHVAGLALELGVTPKLITAWRRWWKTRGQFLDPESLSRPTMETVREAD